VAIFVAGAPVVEAAVSRVNVTRSVPIRIKDTGNGRVDAEAVGKLGLSQAEGSPGALSVQTFAGGGGLIGTGDCDANDAPPDRPNEFEVAPGEEVIITGIIVTGDDANVSVTAPDLVGTIGPGPVANIRSTTVAPNAFIGLGNGLTVRPSRLVFECTAVGGGAGSGDFVILGQ